MTYEDWVADYDDSGAADCPVRLTCHDCGHTWMSDEGDECDACGSEDTAPASKAGVVCSHCGAQCHGEAYCGRCGARVHYDYDNLACREDAFADPGGDSALRAASASNPRIFPCPTCGEPDRLTPADRALGYQCNDCSRRAEGWGE